MSGSRVKRKKTFIKLNEDECSALDRLASAMSEGEEKTKTVSDTSEAKTEQQPIHHQKPVPSSPKITKAAAPTLERLRQSFPSSSPQPQPPKEQQNNTLDTTLSRLTELYGDVNLPPPKRAAIPVDTLSKYERL